MFNDFKDIINVKDLCTALNICQNKAYELLQTNKIKNIKIGRIYKIPKACVIEYIESLTISNDYDTLIMNNEGYSISKERGAI